jgi:hypothetical protein
MTDTFSTPAEHAFEHNEIEDAIAGPSTMGDATEELSVEEAFEVEDTIQRIRAGGYKTVGHCLPTRTLFDRRVLINRLDYSFPMSCFRIRSRCLELFKRESRIPVLKPMY